MSVRRFGRYELIEKIATGGMAEIFLGRQHAFDDFHRLVVVKRILPELSKDATFVRMFLDEARTSAELNHPNVVQIFDLGVLDDAYFIAMELIEGEDLVELTYRAQEVEKPIPKHLACRIVADTCKALHHAHEQVGSDGESLGIVHRDVSPHNILVTYEGAVKIVDFGIAKARTQSEPTKGGILKGKYSYMSPEQCRAEGLDRRSDIFSLGIVMYELTTGRRLFDLENGLDVLEAITEAPIPRPTEIVEGYPPDLESIVMRALERNPDDRFETALEMQRAIEGYLRTQPLRSSNFYVGVYVHELFDEIIEEKRRIIDALVKAKTKIDFETLELRSRINTDIFRRPERHGLAMGPTVLGRRGQTVARAPIATRSQWRYVRQVTPPMLQTMSPTTALALICSAAAVFMSTLLLILLFAG